MKRLLGLLLLMALWAGSCCAQEIAFGGSAEDMLLQAAAAGGGFFAVGKTASADGTLDTRSRSGETGWAVRADADGRQMWYFCSGKSGMCEMTAPHAYADGRCSLVLTDETHQRGEWIVLSALGRQQSRTAIPALSALCCEGQAGSLIAMTPALYGGEPCLTLLQAHEDSGALCCAALFADGDALPCGHFYGDAYGVLLPMADGTAVYAGTELGALSLTRLVPYAQIEHITIPLADGDVGVARVTDALADGDGSIVVSAQTLAADQKSASLLMRLNAEGEVLFMRAFEEDGLLSMLTETSSGYAVYAAASNSVIFFDEDGGLQGSADAQGTPLDLVPAGDGVLALTHDARRGRRQAVFQRISRPQGEAVQETAQPDRQESQTQTAPQRLALARGHLLCSGATGGVTVTRIGEDGEMLWQTRVPIHTAADRLVWESARLNADGSVLLVGFYETDMPQGALREGAEALLGADGVLKEIGLRK